MYWKILSQTHLTSNTKPKGSEEPKLPYKLPAGKIFPIQLQCSCNICVIYNYILISHYNISFVTMRVILLFFQNTTNQTKLKTILNFFNPSHFKCNPPSFPPPPPPPPHFSSKNFSPLSPTQSYLEKFIPHPLNEGGVIYGLQGDTGFTTKIKGNPSIVYNFEGICQHVDNC